jgi:hypothetical protein
MVSLFWPNLIISEFMVTKLRVFTGPNIYYLSPCPSISLGLGAQGWLAGLFVFLLIWVKSCDAAEIKIFISAQKLCVPACN